MFEQHEELIRELIKKAHAPVLGLLGGLMPPGARSALSADVRINPSARAFSQRLDKYPALFAVWLAEHVMLGLGSTGHFDVYPHVQKALGGVGSLNGSDRADAELDKELAANSRAAIEKANARAPVEVNDGGIEQDGLTTRSNALDGHRG